MQDDFNVVANCWQAIYLFILTKNETYFYNVNMYNVDHW